MKTRPILPPTYLITSLLAMAVLHYTLPLAKLLSYPLNLIGIVPLALGSAFNLIADAAFKRYGTTVKPFKESSALITTGVFRLSRHPMYLGMVLILLGVALLLGTLTPFVIVVGFAILLDWIFIRSEEKMLEAKFGRTWLEYKAKVRRWI